jgi:hypothetical protein
VHFPTIYHGVEAMSLLAWIVLIFILFWIFQDRSTASTHPVPSTSQVDRVAKSSNQPQARKNSPFPDLEKQIRSLAKTAWATEAAFYDRDFFLNPEKLSGVSHERVLSDNDFVRATTTMMSC